MARHRTCASGQPVMQLTGWAAERLAAMTPEGHEAIVHVTLTDDHPWAQAFVVIEARPTAAQLDSPACGRACSATKARAGAGISMATTAKDGIVETIKTVVYALLIAGVFRTLFYQPFWIPSGSMKDTLLIGDFLFVNKMAYGYSRYSCPFAACPITGRLFASEPERGDVVVFRHPVQRLGLHQAADRPARRHRAGEGRRPLPERPACAAGAMRVFSRRSRRRRARSATCRAAPTTRSASAASASRNARSRRCRTVCNTTS